MERVRLAVANNNNNNNLPGAGRFG